MPIEGQAGLLGVMALYRRDRDCFTRDDLRILASIVPKSGLAIDNALKFRKMEVRANTDALTDLPNSTLLMQFLDTLLDRCRRNNERVCVAVYKLADLPEFRNAMGSALADQLLRSVAIAMKESCRQDDYIARLDDDRFTLVFPGMGPADITGKMARLNAIVTTAVRAVGGVGMVRPVSAQAYYPDDADRAKRLLEIVDSRLQLDAGVPTESLLALEAQTRGPVPESQPVERRLSA